MHDSSFPIPLTVYLALVLYFYVRGWLRLRTASPRIVAPGFMTTFACGILSIWAAVASPVAALDDESLSAHMVQHLLLMAVAPALILMGRPALPLLHGIPKSVVRSCVAPLLRSSPMRQLARIGSHPVLCWSIATLTVIGWHFPAMFALGLHSLWWHEIQHGTFLLSGFVFWLPVIEQRAVVAHSPKWSVPFYLFLATFPCDALSAFLTFCGRVVYPSYLLLSHPFGISALQDQEWAGVIMWVCITFIYMVPAMVLTVRMLSPKLEGHPQIAFTNQLAGAAQVEVK